MRLAALLCLLPLPALAAPPLVVTDIPPVHALTAQVMGALGSPVLLLAPGADEHDFQLRPSQMRDIAGAGLIVWIGPELTPWLDRASAGATATSLRLLEAPGTTLRVYADADGAEEDHGDDHSGTDPHVWLNPDNAARWLPLIAAELSLLDPANAATYAANASAAAADIAALEAEIADRLAPIRALPFASQHDAYGYFIDHFGLTFAGSVADGSAADPGAAHLSDLRARLETGEVACLFPEVQHDPAMAAQLAEGTPARLGGALDPVGAAMEPGPGAYALLLRAMADTLAACLLP
ncbi:MAG: zinc ABC transporter substrate-binding protein [Paracoccaceae bacterium]